MYNDKFVRPFLFLLACFVLSACSHVSREFVYETDQIINYRPAMAVIQGGSFNMGCVSNIACENQRRAYSMYVPGFFMATHETSVGLWKEIMGSVPPAPRYSFGSYQSNPREPIHKISRKQVFEFISKLNQKTGMNFRLPTEAEWEYAARANTTTVFHWGNSISESNASYNTEPWNCSNCMSSEIGEVGRYPPNNFDLYDMSGHVSEMTQDCYASDYEGQPTKSAPRRLGCLRGAYVVRGGSVNDRSADIRLSTRATNNESTGEVYIGFRLAHDF